CGLPLAAPVDVAFNWVDAEGPVGNASVTTLETPIGVGPNCPTNYGVFADELQLAAIKAPAEARPGEGYEPNVDWIVLQQPLRAERRTISLEQVDGEAVFTCQGFADIHSGLGANATFGEVRGWFPPGLRVHADGCPIAMPADAPTGEYALFVSFTDADGEPLSVMLPDGSVSATTRLSLGAVTVR
ncbi:MAG: hypothetical protein AAF125_16420, partial [Chloroflexota bacterium]